MINENSNGVVEFDAGKIAIIPFCNGLDDDAFSMRIYRDASFAIRASGGSSKTTVSKSLVQAAIDEVGLHTDDFCSQEQALKVARFLKAENILTGNIIQLPDNQLRVICEVLHVPSQKYSQEIVVTDSNIQNLRKNLKKEIQNILK